MKQILPQSKIKNGSTSRDEGSLATDVLSYLASDPERLASFIDSTGFVPAMVRQSATDPSFINGLLDYMMSDETLLVEFASHMGQPPEFISASIRRRRGPIEEV